MSIPFNKRAYQVFLSHSSKDKDLFVDTLRNWLSHSCGVRVYYDRDAEATPIASQVANAIGNSQAALFVVSANSRASGWVRAEFNSIHEEAMRHEPGKFRIVGIQLGDTEPLDLLKGVKLIQVRGNAMTQDDCMILIETLFGGGDPTGGKPTYFSRGWHDADLHLGDHVQNVLNETGLRLVADWPTQDSYDDDRIDRLIGSCGALAAVLPLREQSKTSKYVIREIRTAQRLKLPCLVFSDARVAENPEWNFSPIKLDAGSVSNDNLRELYAERIEDLSLEWRKPPLGQHVFVGHSDAGVALKPMHRMISRLTGLPVVFGRMLEGADVPSEIVQKIRDSEFAIIDITNPYPNANLPDKANFALNSAIEAGIAMGAGRPVYLTCAGDKDRSPPFMFRTAQVRYYADALQLVGHINQFCGRHRRIVIR